MNVKHIVEMLGLAMATNECHCKNVPARVYAKYHSDTINVNPGKVRANHY